MVRDVSESLRLGGRMPDRSPFKLAAKAVNLDAGPPVRSPVNSRRVKSVYDKENEQTSLTTRDQMEDILSARVKRREEFQRCLKSGVDDEFYCALLAQADALIEELEAELSDLEVASSSKVIDNPAALRSTHHSEIMEKLATFGLTDFRPLQYDIIAASLDAKDVVVLMPTGHGKSLCYQLPGICSTGKTSGLTVVISPLKALIKQQTEYLLERNIDAVNASVVGIKQWKTWALGAMNTPLIALITPEKLCGNGDVNEPLDALYAHHRIARFVFDEAHCIPDWGKTFRLAFANCCDHVRTRYPDVPIIALTGTATDCQVLDIKTCLRLRNPLVFRLTSNRPNLVYKICQKSDDPIQQITDFIDGEGYTGRTGIIYCAYQKTTLKVAQQLQDIGLEARPYHGSLPESEKVTTQNSWLEGTTQVVVATTAFGMGIDKADVRFIVHYDVPRNLSRSVIVQSELYLLPLGTASYSQESGRSGRDGHIATCLLLYSESSFKSLIGTIRRDRELTGALKQLQIRQLNLVKQYCVNADCRRSLLLDALDERDAIATCDLPCDNCADRSGADIVTMDLTMEAKFIVKVVNASSEALTTSDFHSRLLEKFEHRMDTHLPSCLTKFDIADMMLSRLVAKSILSCRYEKSPDSRWHNEFLTSGRCIAAFLATLSPERLVIRLRSWVDPRKPVRSRRAPSIHWIEPLQETDSDIYTSGESDDEDVVESVKCLSVYAGVEGDEAQVSSDRESLNDATGPAHLFPSTDGGANRGSVSQDDLLAALENERDMILREQGIPAVSHWPGEHPVLSDAAILEMSRRCPRDHHAVTRIINEVYPNWNSPYVKSKCAKYKERFAALCIAWRTGRG